MRASNLALLILLILVGCFLPTGPGRRVALSNSHSLKTPLSPMRGPLLEQKVLILDDQPAELVWLQGFSCSVIDAQGAPQPEGFLNQCNLDLLNVQRHSTLMKFQSSRGQRLFGLCEGSASVRFPAGFGIPILSNEPCTLFTQLKGHTDAELSVSGTLDFLRQRGLEKPMVALQCLTVYSLVASDGEARYYGIKSPDPTLHGPGTAPFKATTSTHYKDSFEQEFTALWALEPGKQQSRTLVTELLQLSHDTVVHYAAAYLHPYADSLELRDLSEQKTVLRLRVKEKGPGGELKLVEQFSDVDGVKLFKDHQYELICNYDNTGTVDLEAAAVLYLYVRDQEFSLDKLPPRS